MSRQASRDTAPEVSLRRNLHALGLRYRVHVRPVPELRRTADIVFTRARVAVYVDGCFWHSCPRPRDQALCKCRVVGNEAREERRARRGH